MWRPGTIKPARTEAMISVIDLAPTLLELAEVKIDPRVQGVSFAEVLAKPQAAGRDYAFAEHNWHVGQAHERSVRNGRWLYIRNAYPEVRSECVESGPMYPAGKELWDAHAAGTLNANQGDIFLAPRPAEELYDVKADPDQLHNLAADSHHAATLTALRQRLDEWTAETGDTVPTKPTAGVPVVGRGQGMEPDFKRGEIPGAAKDASAINAPGPIRSSD